MRVKHTPTSSKLRKTARAIGSTFNRVISALTEEEINTVEDDPAAVLEIALEKLPAAVLRELRSKTKQEQGRQPIPAAVRRAVLKRDKERCVVCERAGSLHLHHYVPVAKGGVNATGNLVTLCANCHMAVHYGYVSTKKPRQVPLEPAIRAAAAEKPGKEPLELAAKAESRKSSSAPAPSRLSTRATGNTARSKKPCESADKAKAEPATKTPAISRTRKMPTKAVTGAEDGKPAPKKPRQKTVNTQK